jgi:hypothetical protein
MAGRRRRHNRRNRRWGTQNGTGREKVSGVFSHHRPVQVFGPFAHEVQRAADAMEPDMTTPLFSFPPPAIR